MRAEKTKGAPGVFCARAGNVFDYKSVKWKRKREQILRRDGYQCCQCRRYGKCIQATTVHHKKHVNEYPELSYDDDNLESLCTSCHNKVHPEKPKGNRY